MILFIRFVARIATRSRARSDIFSLPFVRAISFRLDRLVNVHASRNFSHLFVAFRWAPRMPIFYIYFSIFSYFHLPRCCSGRGYESLFSSHRSKYIIGKCIEHLHHAIDRYQLVNCRLLLSISNNTSMACCNRYPMSTFSVPERNDFKNWMVLDNSINTFRIYLYRCWYKIVCELRTDPF